MKLVHERKENEILIKKLKNENEKLKLAQPLNYKNYMKWTEEEVFKFFMTMFDDGCLDKYKEAIRKGIFEIGYNGEALSRMNSDNGSNLLKELGIINVTIRLKVLEKISDLKNSQYNNNNSNTNEADPGQ